MSFHSINSFTNNKSAWDYWRMHSKLNEKLLEHLTNHPTYRSPLYTLASNGTSELQHSLWQTKYLLDNWYLFKPHTLKSITEMRVLRISTIQCNKTKQFDSIRTTSTKQMHLIKSTHEQKRCINEFLLFMECTLTLNNIITQICNH